MQYETFMPEKAALAAKEEITLENKREKIILKKGSAQPKGLK